MLGILVNRQGRLPGLPSFAVTGLHRSLSLLSVLFIAMHVATAIIDPYVTIRLAAVVIPFVSAYKPFWLGLGAVSLDLVAALILTSLARARICRGGPGGGIHWLAYAAWPVALVHSIGSSHRSAQRRAAADGDRLRAGGGRGAACWRLAATAGRGAARRAGRRSCCAGVQRQARRGPRRRTAGPDDAPAPRCPCPCARASGPPRTRPPPPARRPGRMARRTLPRLMPAHAVPVELAEHLERFGAPPYRGAPRRLIGDVEAAGLTGRGGAAFPTYRKLAAMAAGRGPAPVVIGNGAEGEPASSKDKSLLWFSPHLVLDGLQLAAEAVGSVTVALYIHRNPRLQERLAAAIAERAAAGLDAAAVELDRGAAPLPGR